MGYTIGQFLDLKEIKDTLKFNKQYHQKVFFPAWFENNLGFQNIIDGLKATKFSDEDIKKIMGGNWYNFFKSSFTPLDTINNG